ncbi:MAG: hypothetical protein ACYSU0_02800 [Planctomycetota bacterium]
MGTRADMAMIALLAAIYGGMIVVGGLFWFFGWKRENERLSKVGDVAVLLGLFVDFVLLNASRFFDWVGWLETRVQ